ncbi:MAG: hypothetical protein QW084_03320, partial [Candidatus Hadarchaeales archaeon]
ESGRKASEFDATLPLYFQVKERVPCPNELKGRVMEELVREFSSHPLDRTDGLKIQTEDGWLLLRPSGTEPIFRCFAEARTEERAMELAELGLRKLREVTGKMAV